MLACIFAFQGFMLFQALRGCRSLALENKTDVRSIHDSCPSLAQKAENLFNVSVATVLSLLSTKEKEF